MEYLGQITNFTRGLAYAGHTSRNNQTYVVGGIHGDPRHTAMYNLQTVTWVYQE